MLVRRIVAVGLCAGIFCLSFSQGTPPAWAHDGSGVELGVAMDPQTGQVTLTWTGGQPTFEIFRSAQPTSLFDTANSLGTTEGRAWIDQPPPGVVWYYQVESPCVFDPPEVCDGVDNDCDGEVDGPGVVDSCDLPDATAACVAGSCMVDQCFPHYSNCDGDHANGCELFHGSAPDSCPAAESLGGICGDVACGFLCSGTDWRVHTTRTGRTSQWFHAQAYECSDCCADIRARITLVPPVGTDYDLYVYVPCGTPVAGSQNGGDAVEQVEIYSQDDCFFESQDFDYWIEVRYYSGASCESWWLTIEGRSCQD